jgi:hypothetical protein
MRNVERGSNTPGIMNVLARTARTFAPYCFAMVIKLQRYAHNIISRNLQHGSHDRRINAARHGNDHPVIAWVSTQPHGSVNGV